MFREFETWKCPAAVTITIHEYVFHSSVLHPFPPLGIPDREQKKKLAGGTLYGVELVDGVARICCMNMLLHGISGNEAKEVRLIPAAMPMSNHGGKRSASRDACTAGKISQYPVPTINGLLSNYCGPFQLFQPFNRFAPFRSLSEWEAPIRPRFAGTGRRICSRPNCFLAMCVLIDVFK